MTPCKVVVVSNMRTGSTWLSRMLQKVLGHPEPKAWPNGTLAQIASDARQRIDSQLIQKHHGDLHTKIFDAILPNDYTIVTVVRNPRDMLASHAFFVEPRIPDLEPPAVRERIKARLTDDWGPSMARQLDRMEPGYGTRNKVKDRMPYVWTSYEWLKEAPARELLAILDCLGTAYDQEEVLEVAEDFGMQAPKNDPGSYRKGIVGDWVNYFDVELLDVTRQWQEEYWRRLLKESVAASAPVADAEAA
jgi:hypothetical protein